MELATEIAYFSLFRAEERAEKIRPPSFQQKTFHLHISQKIGRQSSLIDGGGGHIVMSPSPDGPQINAIAAPSPVGIENILDKNINRIQPIKFKPFSII